MLYNNSEITDNAILGGLNDSPSFAKWREISGDIADSCFCHSPPLVNNLGNGSITVTASNQVFTNLDYIVTFSISGFIEAQDEEVAIGFIEDYENNSDFLFGDEARSAPDIPINSSGGTNNVAIVTLKAPDTIGNYTLKAHAVNSVLDEGFNFINKIFNVEVIQAPDSEPPTINSILFNDEVFSNGSEIGGQYLVEVDVSDDYLAGVKFNFNETGDIEMTLNSSTSLYYSELSTFGLSNGQASLLVTAYDSNSNEATVKFNFEVNNTGIGPNADIISWFINEVISISDSKIDEIWEDVNPLFISELGSEGFVKSSQNGFFLYVLLAYDSSYNWISVEFDAISGDENHMLEGHDGWTFGNSTTIDREYLDDGYFTGADEHPKSDFRNDLLYEIFAKGSLTYVEIIRPLDTKDVNGYDVIFNDSTIINVQFASSKSHFNGHTVYTWILTDLSAAGGTVTPPPDTPSSNPAELSDIVFVFSFTLVVFSVLIHGALRVISRPIKHEKRIVYTDRLPNQPSLKEVIRERRSKPDSKED
ncbi:MAG: hypothetical protein HeimC3_30900 [Candidatus Heimdallarchaeota archaeon LC_3]|nr:MAG: hypothetical protein HeimC3_30900 [Candidatus Heimdallarchaeota archaeon LC_3]